MAPALCSASHLPDLFGLLLVLFLWICYLNVSALLVYIRQALFNIQASLAKQISDPPFHFLSIIPVYLRHPPCDVPHRKEAGEEGLCFGEDPSSHAIIQRHRYLLSSLWTYRFSRRSAVSRDRWILPVMPGALPMSQLYAPVEAVLLIHQLSSDHWYRWRASFSF